MKIAFTTLGCPKWDLNTIIKQAKAARYDGVDFRGYLGEIQIFKRPEFSTGLADTVKLLADSGLEVPCFASSARVCTQPVEAIDEIRQYAPLCKAFGARFIRVFGGDFKDMPKADAIKAAVQTLKEAAPIARDHGVKLVMETHDAWLSCDLTRQVMEAVNSPDVGMLWDVHHPYRMLDEAPAATWAALGKWIAYTHVKDSKLKTPAGKPRDHQYCLPGEGDIPLHRIFDVLKNAGYKGYLTLEWEKMWCPEIEEPEIAFPAYAKYMLDYLGR